MGAEGLKSSPAASLVLYSHSDRSAWLNVNEFEYDYGLFMDSDGRVDSG